MLGLPKYLVTVGLLTIPGTTSIAGGAPGTESVRVIEVHARRFAFSPAEITLKKGQPVELKLISDDVAHSLLIKDLGINQIVTRNKPAVVTVTPSHDGTYLGQCGRFCGEGHGRMSFTIHVTEN